ncbi:helix-turn-helix domain-containing protein [candidate division KSB1 bacterium]|nr:helix-turn-helix domain-containing protein [candidate division KSB1 bacterium]RQW02341.1 MAG: helix-turn-helix domain-containing protein [candidate division KSB1 bacterium]
MNKICASKEFANHDHYEPLLRYLVASTLKNETPKEISIAMEIFKKNRDYDPTLDSTVRVYVHNLRKKLQSYYHKEGKDDNIQILIPKGHYKVEFQENYAMTLNRSKSPFILLGAIILLLLVAMLGMLFIHHNKNIISKNDPVWGDVLENSQKTTIVLGDHYFFKGHFFGQSWNIRDVQINSDNEFEDYLDTLALSPEIGTLGKYAKSYFPTRIPWSLSNIASLFHHNHISFDMRIGSNFQWNEINKNNIIYIGSFRGTGVLMNVLQEQIHYNSENHELTMLTGDTTKTQSVFAATLTSDYPMIDYAIVVKRPGPRNNTLFFFLSTHDIGTIETTNLFSDPENIKEFENAYLRDREIKYFEAVFEVKGFSHSSMEHRLVYFNDIEK